MVFKPVRFAASLLCLLATAYPGFASVISSPDVIGEAYDLAGEQLLYTEYHYYSDDGLRQQIIYQSADGVEIARKSMDYQAGATVPAFRQDNTRHDEYVEVSWRQDKLVLSYVRDGGDTVSEKVIAAPDSLVIDAGFNAFIQQQWQDLTAGETIGFAYPVPTRSTIMKMKISRVDCDEKNRQPVCFTIKVDNFLLGWLLAPIEVTYDSRSRQLLRYRGLSNVLDANGDGMKVAIRYSYPQQACGEAADC
jgi:hypothetical protein